MLLGFQYCIPTENSLRVNTEYSFELETTNLETMKNAIAIKGEDQVGFDVYDGNTHVATGKAENSGDGKIKVTITFTDDASSYFKGSEGAFWFHASFNADNIANTGKQSINISSSKGASCTKIINFEVAPVKAALNVSKVWEEYSASEQSVDDDTGYIKWKIKANPTLSGYKEGEDYLTEFVIEDTLPNQLNGLKVDRDKTDAANKNLTSDSAYSIEYTTDGDTVTRVTLKANADGGKISVKEVTFYVVTGYKTSEVINYLKDNQVIWENTASATMTYPDYTKVDGIAKPITSTKPSDKVTATYRLTGVQLSKSNGEVQEDGTIKWTITATNGIGVPEPYLLDKLPDGLVLDKNKAIQINDKVISSSNSYSAGSYTYDDDSNELKIYLNSGRDEQIITYYTTYKNTSMLISSTLTNQVDFRDSEGIITTRYGYVTPGRAYISKEGSYKESTHTIDWKVTLTNLNMTTGTLKVNDDFGESVGQILQTGSIKIKIGTSGSELTVNNDNGIYTVDGTQVGRITIDNDNKGFVIQFSDNAFADGAILNKIRTMTITYTTMLNEAEIDNWINKTIFIANTVTIKADGIPSLSNTGYVNASTPVYSKKFVSYDYETHTATWELTVNHSKMALDNPIVTDVITDTDLNWEYKADGLAVKQGGNVLSKDSLVSAQTYHVEYTNSADNQPSMTVFLPTISDDMVGTDNAEFVITYQTTIADDASLKKLATNDTIMVENNATLSGAPIKTDIQDSKSFPIGAGQISKTGTDINSSTREITWIIDVNKNNAIIDGKGEKVAVCDVLQTGLLYLEDSLVVYGLTEDRGTWTQAELNPSAYKAAYDDETRKLTITFKDDSDAVNCITKAYRIAFNTRVLVSGEYTNLANFVADESTDNRNSSKKQVSGKFGGGYISLKMNGAALLLIRGKDTSDAAVGGGEFELYKEGVSTPIATLAADGTWSNSDGEDYNAFIWGLPYGSYILKRTVTPDSYKDNALEAYSITLSADSDQAIIDVLYLKDTEIENMADVIFSKEILGAGEEIAGAALTLTYENGGNTLAAVGTKSADGSPAITKTDDNKSISWVSTETPLTLTYLPEGEYSLTEKNAPQGYAYTETICFEIKSGEVYMKKTDGTYEMKPLSVSDGGERVITMVDDVVRTYFSKKAAGSGNELPGAEIKLTSSGVDLSAVKPSKTSGGKDFTNDGAAITWISTDTLVELTMLPDGEYTMTETAAPEGYLYAFAISFKIEKGRVYLYNEESDNYEYVSDSTVTMTDESLGATFSKTIAGGGLELPGAVLTLTGESDLSNVEKTAGPDFKLSADRKIITWTSTDTPLSLKGLPDGIYTLHEEGAPEGYAYASDIRFKIENGTIYLMNEAGIYDIVSTNKIVMVDEAAAFKTDDEENRAEEDYAEEDHAEEKDTKGLVVDTRDHIYPVLLLCVVLMFLSAVVMYAACYRKNKDLMK